MTALKRNNVETSASYKQDLLMMSGPKWMNSFSCDDCEMEFNNLKDFTTHRRLHIDSMHYIHLKQNDIPKDVCPYCNLSFYFESLPPDTVEEIKRLEKRKNKRKTQPPKIIESKYCIICKISLRNVQEFLLHSKQVHGLDRPYQCTKCNFSSSLYHVLKRHFYSHENRKLYACHLCPNSYASHTALKGHMLTHSEVHMNSHDCKICDKKFPILTLLKRHLRTHDPVQKSFECKVCLKKFGYLQSLKRHNLMHTGDKPYQCSVCDKGFTESFKYKLHMKRQHNQIIGKVIHCKLCDEKFLAPYLLKQHMRIHNNDNRNKSALICEVCSKPFKSKKRLIWHEKTHTGDLPYNCEECGKKFAAAWEYSRHKLIHMEPSEESVECEHCGKQFSAMYKLETHVKIHDKRYKCDFCSRSYAIKSLLKNHLLTHEGKEPYICMHCGKKFVSPRRLKEHLNPDKNSEKPLRCKDCCITFSNRNCFRFHCWTHNNKYICNTCNKRYSTSIAFKNHLNQHVRDDTTESATIKEET